MMNDAYVMAAAGNPQDRLFSLPLNQNRFKNRSHACTLHSQYTYLPFLPLIKHAGDCVCFGSPGLLDETFLSYFLKIESLSGSLQAQTSEIKSSDQKAAARSQPDSYTWKLMLLDYQGIWHRWVGRAKTLQDTTLQFSSSPSSSTTVLDCYSTEQ